MAGKGYSLLGRGGNGVDVRCDATVDLYFIGKCRNCQSARRIGFIGKVADKVLVEENRLAFACLDVIDNSRRHTVD